MIPKLPKKINRRESKVDGKVAQWLVKNHPCKNWLLEVKMKGGKLREHQESALRQVENGKFLWKPQDGQGRLPGDYIRLGDADAILCVVDGKKVTCDINHGTFTHTFTL